MLHFDPYEETLLEPMPTPLRAKGKTPIEQAKRRNEHKEQVTLIEWCEWNKGTYPDLEMIYAIPNGGFRFDATAGRLKAEGVKPGVPDLMLPVPRGTFHGLYIEMKAHTGGRVSEHQAAWHEKLKRQGYAVAVCPGWEAARDEIINYLQLL